MARRPTGVAGVPTLAVRNLRRLRSDGAAPWVLCAVVLVASFGATGAPRFLASVSNDALRTAVIEASPGNRNISVEQAMRIPPGEGDDVFAGARARGTELHELFVPSVKAIVYDRTLVVDSPSFVISKLPGVAGDPPPRRFRFRHQQGVAEHIAVVAGRLPEPAPPALVAVEDGATPREIPTYEVAISADAADRLELGVGDRALIEPDLEDPLQLRVPRNRLDYHLLIEISGIIEPTDVEEEYWFGDQRLNRASSDAAAAEPDLIIVSGVGLMSPEDYGRLLGDTRGALWNYEWRYLVDPASFGSDDVASIIAGIQDLELDLGAGSTRSIDEPRLSTGLERISERYLSDRRLTLSVLSLVSTGLIALGLAVVALLSALIAHRRRDATVLVRSRGASARQLGWAQLLESLALLVPAAVLGFALAGLFVDGRWAPFAPAISVLVALVVSGVGVVFALPLLRGHLGSLLGDEPPDVGRGSAKRIVAEVLVIIAAIVGLALFRRRGFEAGGLVDDGRGVDLFLAAVPVLLAVAFGLVILRLFPILIRLVGRYGARRRGAVGFVGVSRLRRQPLSARLPLSATLLAVGIAIFAALLAHSIDESRLDSTWHDVGADYRIEPWQPAEPLSRFTDVSGVAGIEARADATLLNARVGASLAPSRSIQLLAADTAGYQLVAAGTRADPEFPESLIEPFSTGRPAAPGPIPALVSSRWPGDDGPEPGDAVTVEIGRQSVQLLAVEVRDSFPALDIDRPFVVVPEARLAGSLPTLDLRVNRIYVRASDDVGPVLEATVRGQSSRTRVVSREALLDELGGAPLVTAVDDGYRIAVWLATVLAVLAALAGIALTSRERFRDLGYLRTLGLSARQVSLLTMIEQVPAAVLSTAAGVGFGYALVWLVRPGLDLTPFGGTTFTATITVDWVLVILVAAAVFSSLMGAVGIYSYRTRKLKLANVLRMGDRA